MIPPAPRLSSRRSRARRRFVRAVTDGSSTATTWYAVFPGGCVTARLRAVSRADAAVVTDAASIVGFATRQGLQQALDQRSNGRLQLDPGRQG